MYDEIFFDPDPRSPKHDLIGVDNEQQYDQISIQLGSKDTYGKDASHSALLELNNEGLYELNTYDPERMCFDKVLVFSDTRNHNTVLNQIEGVFKNGRLKPHFIDENSKPKLVYIR